MSMYDIMTGGPHPLAGAWLVRVLGVDPRQVNRLRNVYIVDSEEDGKPIIYVLTRSQDNPVLKMHPKLIRDRKAYSDDTYWEFEFELPAELHEEAKALGPIVMLPRFAKHFEIMIGQLKDESNPVSKEMLERARPMVESLAKKLNDGEGPSIIDI